MPITTPPAPERVEAAEAYLRDVMTAHQEFASSLQHASVHLAQQDGTLPRIAATLNRLVRDMLDAHRTILRHRAEVDLEVERMLGTVVGQAVDDDHVEDVQVARLRRVLDAWWWSEVESADRLLSQAAAAQSGPSGAGATSGSAALRALPSPEPDGSSRLPAELLDRLDRCDGASLPAMLDELLGEFPTPQLPDAGEVPGMIENETARFDEWVNATHPEVTG